MIYYLDININICQYVDMKKITDTFKLLTDEQRIRILMLLSRKELCICQLMGIIGASQSLISRNVALLYRAGFLEERRDGKLRCYRIRKDLPDEMKDTMNLLKNLTKSLNTIKNDIETLKECTEFQKKVGTCDMKTLKIFMKQKKRRDKYV
jgi:ArsR family transcriptional regulator